MKAAIIYASVHHENTKKVVEAIAGENVICTCGGNAAFRSIEEIVKSKQGKIAGKFSCKGYDTFGPFKLVGGIAKGHPNDKDLADAVTFYKGIIRR